MTKSVLRRSLEIFYIVFIVIHLVVSLPFNFIAIYPSWLVFGPAKEVVRNYIKDLNDPWMKATWDLVPRPYEWLWTKVILWFEMLYFVPIIILTTYALIRDKPVFYPFILIYTGMTIVTTTMVLVMYIYTPIMSEVENLKSTPQGEELAFYAMPEGARLFSVIGSVVFLAPPVMMAVDVAIRTVRLIQAGVAAEEVRKKA